MSQQTTKDWIEDVTSAWKGHRNFAEWLVDLINPHVIVELGVDYGYSTYVFGQALQKNKKEKKIEGRITGVDLFLGDVHAGERNTLDFVKDNIQKHDLTQIDIVVSDFAEYATQWKQPIDILHIDGLHTLEAVTEDFKNWAPFVRMNGVILFHDVAIEEFGIKDFFHHLKGGHKLYFKHSAGLGIYTRNTGLYEQIKKKYGKHIHDENITPLI